MKAGSGGGARRISVEGGSSDWAPPAAALAALATASSASREVGATRATRTGFGGAEFEAPPPPFRTSSPGTVSRVPGDAVPPPSPPLASGPAENLPARDASGRGPLNFVAGFNPITATFTLVEGNPAASRVGASWIAGVTGFPAAPFPPPG